MKLHNFLFLSFLFLFSCKQKEETMTINNITGNWKIIQEMPLDNMVIDSDELNSCIGKKITFTKDSIINHTQCMFSSQCNHPNYHLKKVNTMAYFENDSDYIKQAGFHSDSIYVVSTTCDHAYYGYIAFISKDTLTLGADDRLFIMAKE